MSHIEKITRTLAPPPPPVAAESGDDWLDVQALFRIVRRRFGLIFVVGSACARRDAADPRHGAGLLGAAPGC